MGFWGPKMAEAIEYAVKLGVSLHQSPARFAQEVDILTGLHHAPNSSPEDCAELWLPKLREMVLDNFGSHA